MFGWQSGEVFRNLHLGWAAAQEEFHLLPLLRGAKDEAHRFVLRLRPPLVFLEPSQVKVHLAFVSGDERANLEVYGHQAAQAAMVEEEIEPVVVVVYAHWILTTDEAEVAAEFREELLEVGQDGGFQVFLGIRPLEAEKVEQAGIFEGVFVADGLQRAALFFEADEGAGVALEGHSLEQRPVDLTLKLAL